MSQQVLEKYRKIGKMRKIEIFFPKKKKKSQNSNMQISQIQGRKKIVKVFLHFNSAQNILLHFNDFFFRLSKNIILGKIHGR